jgi:hypothetical protein
MTVIPQTEVRLLSGVPLTNKYDHQLTFDNTTEQANYFLGKSSRTFLDFTYQREEVSIKVPTGYDSLYLCNYVMYKNKDFAGKWFYGFITKKEYVNPNTTKVYFEIDVYQTWQFELTFKKSFVEREHTDRWNTDGSPIVNTIAEDLNYGTEYETVSVEQVVPMTDVFYLVIVCQKRMDTNGDTIEPIQNGGIQPLTYYIHPFKMDGSVPAITVDGQPQTLSSVKEVLLTLYKSTVAVNNISALYVTEYIGEGSLNFQMSKMEPVNIETTNVTTLRVVNYQTYNDKTISLGDKYEGFTNVTESKLLMHPYTVTILSDMKGNQQEIKSEYIQGNTLAINVKGSMGVSNKVAYNVKNYLMSDTIENSGEVAISNGIINNSPNDVPIITDLLSAYLQGNRNTLENQKSSILWNQSLGAVGNALTASPLGMVHGLGNGYLEMKGLLAKQQDINNTPPQLNRLGGNTAFDYGNGIKGLYVIKKEITDEYRDRLTDFFKMYGYKINDLKVPNLKTREHFNFVKTGGAIIFGNAPNDDINRIKEMFDTGVTLWHGDWVGEYGLSNGEV